MNIHKARDWLHEIFVLNGWHYNTFMREDNVIEIDYVYRRKINSSKSIYFPFYVYGTHVFLYKNYRFEL